MATLCDYCSAFAKEISALSPASFMLESTLPPIDYRTFVSAVYYHHPNASELLGSALTCPLCSCILRDVEQRRSQYGLVSTQSLDTADDLVIIRVKGRYLRPGEFKVISCLIQTLNSEAICIVCSLYSNPGEQSHTSPYFRQTKVLLPCFQVLVQSSCVASVPFSDWKRRISCYVFWEIMSSSLRLVP